MSAQKEVIETPKISETELKKIITDSPQGLYLLCGDEAYLKRMYLDKIIKANVDDSFADFNLHMVEGDTTDLDELYDLCESVPMMSESKCVVCKDFDCHDVKEKEKAYDEFFGNLPPYTALVFYFVTEFGKTAEQKLLQKYAEKHGRFCSFSKKEIPELASILEKGAVKRGRNFAPGAATYLVQSVTRDLTQLTGELEKLCAYSDGTITKNDIDLLCAKSLDMKVFDMVKDIAARRYDDAMQKLTLLFAQREDELTILGAMISQYADMYRAKTAMNDPVKTSELQSSYESYAKLSFKLPAARQNAKSMSLSQLSLCLDILSEADEKAKSSDVDKKLLLEKTLLRLARVQSTRG